MLAGCGGGGDGRATQVVRADGYRFEVPAGWQVTRSARRAAAADGEVDRVEVTTFPLVNAYRSMLFRAVSRELDGVAAELAERLGGEVGGTETVQVAGRRARAYRIEYDGKVQEITFVLAGRREYQLLCRREADGDRDACTTLTESFRLA